jgi:hypothetical protein
METMLIAMTKMKTTSCLYLYYDLDTEDVWKAESIILISLISNNISIIHLTYSEEHPQDQEVILPSDPR